MGEYKEHEKFLKGLKVGVIRSTINLHTREARSSKLGEMLRDDWKGRVSEYTFFHEFMKKIGRKPPGELGPESITKTVRNLKKLVESGKKRRNAMTINKTLVNMSSLARIESDKLLYESLKELNLDKKANKKMSEHLQENMNTINKMLNKDKNAPIRKIGEREPNLESIKTLKRNMHGDQKEILHKILKEIGVSEEEVDEWKDFNH